MIRVTAFFLVLTLCACATSGQLTNPTHFTSNACRKDFVAARNLPTEKQLDQVSSLYQMSCDQEVIQLASFIRNLRRDKFYSVSAEVGEMFTPEGALTPYTLESYERSFLSVLIAMSYMNLHKVDAALVELRRSREEEAARLYNYGDDPVMALVQAALWDRFDTTISRPYWKRLSELGQKDPELVHFAQQRMNEIDADGAHLAFWHIYGIGEFPDLEWHAAFLVHRGRPYTISPKQAFPESCYKEKSMALSTESWSRKISGRYDSSYHPLLYTKSLVRLPVGIVYGVVGVSAGMAAGVSGCLLASQLRESGAELCNQSVQAAGYLMRKSVDFVDYTLHPDLRRWTKLPGAILITRDGAIECYSGTPRAAFIE